MSGIEKDLVVISRNIWGILKGVGVYLELSLYGGRVYSEKIKRERVYFAKI